MVMDAPALLSQSRVHKLCDSSSLCSDVCHISAAQGFLHMFPMFHSSYHWVISEGSLSTINQPFQILFSDAELGLSKLNVGFACHSLLGYASGVSRGRMEGLRSEKATSSWFDFCSD